MKKPRTSPENPKGPSSESPGQQRKPIRYQTECGDPSTAEILKPDPPIYNGKPVDDAKAPEILQEAEGRLVN